MYEWALLSHLNISHTVGALISQIHASSGREACFYTLKGTSTINRQIYEAPGLKGLYYFDFNKYLHRNPICFDEVLYLEK